MTNFTIGPKELDLPECLQDSNTDLGGVDFEKNPAVARFKDRMNGTEISAAGPYEATPNWFWTKVILGIESQYSRLKGRR